MTEDLACLDVVELLTAFLDGALDPATEHEVREHLAVCEGCERYLEQLQTTIEALSRTGSEAGSALTREVTDNLTAAFRATFPLT